MGAAAKMAVDPANVVQALVYTLLDVFDATRDLHQTLRAKERRDYEENLRSRGRSSSRQLDYYAGDEENDKGDESLALDRSAVNRQFEIGLRDVGTQFAVGDVVTQTFLQSQIITLQSALITTFLYGPTKPDPISKHLSVLVAASREAGIQTVDALSAQQQRQLSVLPTSSRSTRSHTARSSHVQPLPYPVTADGSASTALVKSSRHDHEGDRESAYPAKTTILSNRPKAQRTDTESTAFSGPTSYATSAPPTAYCLYALDLQQHSKQNLSPAITQESTPFCPHCQRTLQLSPGKSWEVIKQDTHLGHERIFHVSNRFVVKCHRSGADAGYCCVLCSQGSGSTETVCGDVKALIKHVWQDHDVHELESEVDVEELGDRDTAPGRRNSVKHVDRRRDSGMGMSSRRSVSLGPSRGVGRTGSGRRRFDRDVVEVVEYGRRGRPI
ncbi:unnamed protein product [Periconia digitata]|uniref:Uncharacterized protein n=1 Tax=Periconia digitata TaxID=1303443 RepID=A0A9W4XLX5_9PLEO|nr:unnamed protein product [Periconia digitata]